MYGQSDSIDRIVQILIGLPAIFSIVFGTYMLLEPHGWYDFVDTVKATGPANTHFIPDIGIAYIVSGMVLGYAALHAGLRWGAGVIGNLWLALHGGLHIYEVYSGTSSHSNFLRDAPGVLGPPAMVFLGLAIQLARQRISPVSVPKPAFISMMRGLGEPYIDDLSKAGGFATEKFQHAMVLVGHRHHASAALLHMACLGSTRFEDCGPCVETVRRYAIAEGLDPNRIENALMGKPDGPEDALAYNFGIAIASGDIGEASELGNQIEERYGRNVRTELALAAASGRLFPALKRGLGYASVCQIPQVS